MKTKKILSLILVLAMFLAVSLPMTAGALTIVTDVNDNVYQAYRLFDLSTTLTCDENIDELHPEHGKACYGYAYTINSKYQTIILDALDITQGTKTVAVINGEAVSALSALTASETRNFANEVFSAIVADGLLHDEESNTDQQFTAVNPGYYLINEVTNPVAKGDSISLIILDTKGEEYIEINNKKDAPTISKKVENLDLADIDKWQDWTDVNFGDTINYKVTGTLPSTLEGYTTYKYNIVDTMSGISYTADSLKIMVEGADVTDCFDIIATDSVLKIECADVLSLTDEMDAPVAIDKDSIFVFTYSAKLNSSAAIGNPGNPNDVYLVYSSNPNPGGEGETANTPHDETVTFTYQLDITKTDTDGVTIAQTSENSKAKFILFRMNESSKEYAQVTDGKVSAWTTEKSSAYIFVTALGKLSIVGLDTGKYFLEETVAPSGYNLLTAPIEFDISSTVEIVTEKNALTSLSIKIGENSTPGVIATGIVSMSVENGTGGIFPGTGGMGRTIFFIGGAFFIVLCTAAFVIHRKKAYKAN